MTTPRSENLRIETLDGARGAWIIKLTGPLTLQTLFDFQQIVRKESIKPIVVDLADTSYRDSAGLGSILSVFASCQRTHRGFALSGLSERIRSLFEVTKVDGILPSFDSLDAAESAVMKPPFPFLCGAPPPLWEFPSFPPPGVGRKWNFSI